MANKPERPIGHIDPDAPVGAPAPVPVRPQPPRRLILQTCPDCNGTGCSKEIEMYGGKQVNAPPYWDKGDINRPRYTNCASCNGAGRTMQPVPLEVVEYGTPIELEDNRAANERFFGVPV